MVTKIAHVGPVAGTTSIASLNYPASGVSAGDLLFLWINYEGAASNVATISGWGAKVMTLAGGGCFKDLYIKTAAGTEGGTGTVGTITITGSTNSLASLVQYRSSTGVFKAVATTRSGLDTVSDTSFSITTTAFVAPAGSFLAYDMVATETTTRSARTFTKTDHTFGTATAYFGSGTGITEEAGDVPLISSSQASNALTFAETFGTAATGIFAIVVLEEQLVFGGPPTPALLAVGGSTTATSPYASGTLSPEANVGLLAVSHVSGTAVANPTVTGLGLTWALASSAAVTGTTQKLAIYTALTGGSAPTPGAVTFTPGGTLTGALFQVVQVRGVSTSAPFGATVPTLSGTGVTNVALTLPSQAAANNRWFLGFGTTNSSNNTVAAPANWTELLEHVYATPATKLVTFWNSAGSAPTTVTPTEDSTYDMRATAIEMIAALPDLVVQNATQAHTATATTLVLPVAAYNFDEVTGSVVDVTGNGNSFSLTGSSTRTTGDGGHTDEGAYQTTSTTDAGPPVMGLTGNRTLMMWIKSTAQITDGRVFETVSADTESIWEFLFRDTLWHLQAWNGVTFARATVTRPTDSAWHHLAGTYDGTSLRLYLDGALVGGPTALAAPLRTDGTSHNLFHTAPTTFIDDARFFSGAMDVGLITAMMNTPVASGAVTLTVANATQAQTSESPALTQDHQLVVVNSTQVQVADGPALTQVHVLALQDAAQAQTADAVTLVLTTALVVADAVQVQTSETATLTQDHNLAVNAAAQAQVSDAVPITAESDLVVAGATQAQSAEQVTFSQDHSLTIQGAIQAQSAGQATLTQVHNLATQDATQTQSPEQVTLTQDHTLTVGGSTQAQAAEQVVLTQEHTLAVAGVNQAQVADQVAVGVDLTAQAAGQSQTSESPSLTQQHSLVVQDATHAQTAGAAGITVEYNLAVDDASQAQTAGQVSLVQVHELVVQPAGQTQTTGVPALTQVHELAVVGAVQAQESDNVTFTAGTSLDVDDATHAQVVGSAVLTQAHQLVVAAAAHTQSADDVSLTGESTLVINSAVHGQTADTVAITGENALEPASSTHDQTAGSPTLTQAHSLVVQGAAQAQESENVSVVPVVVEITLTINDATHGQTAGNVLLSQLNELMVHDASHAIGSTSVLLGLTAFGLYWWDGTSKTALVIHGMWDGESVQPITLSTV